MREKSNIGFFAVKGDKASLNEYIRQIERLSYQVANLRAVRPSDVVETALNTLESCTKEIKAVLHQSLVTQIVDASNRPVVNDNTAPEEKVSFARSMGG